MKQVFPLQEQVLWLWVQQPNMKLGIKFVLGPNFARQQREELGTFVEGVMTDTKTLASKYTPKQSGSASRAWIQQGKGTDTQVVNNKPYIQRLDQGWSKQAPGGILKPTIREIKRKYR